MLTPEVYLAIRDRLVALGHGDDYVWSQTVRAPDTAEGLACEYTWVVLNSGMRNTVARKLMDRVWPRLIDTGRIGDAFGHVGKRGAIEFVWAERVRLLEQFRQIDQYDIVEVLRFCHGLPWIGPITKYHLAKNLGADVAKPDRWLVRLAEAEGESVDGLCQRLAYGTGDRVATVDVVLWRACAIGLLAVVDGAIVMRDQP